MTLSSTKWKYSKTDRWRLRKNGFMLTEYFCIIWQTFHESFSHKVCEASYWISLSFRWRNWWPPLTKEDINFSFEQPNYNIIFSNLFKIASNTKTCNNSCNTWLEHESPITRASDKNILPFRYNAITIIFPPRNVYAENSKPRWAPSRWIGIFYLTTFRNLFLSFFPYREPFSTMGS